ncbi:MAG: Membrane-bound lytic murein transglycosylase D [Flavobacterium sp. SCGC AAA160-P02]|nr:MAG: Membrane-bound lytic murein transglycosylase D [Flavobacterium sp. SCGC AAA160-P02]
MKSSFFFFFFFFSLITLGQVKKDTLYLNQDSLIQDLQEEIFSDKQIALIDSLILENKLNSIFTDEIREYYIPNIDTVNISEFEIDESLLKERLSRINETTPFHIAFNPALEKIIKSYLKHRRKYYPKFMARAAYYFPMIEKYLDQFDIPLEMKYLALVESALLPKAKSRVGATGLWQFMYSTGKQYKLKVSSYVDERQDPIKATIAACNYLNDLYTIFGDWDLTLAAYNSGPGNVSKAIRRSGGYKNYWNIRPFLPRETAGYVPAFYATMYLFTFAKEHNLKGNIPEIYYFETDTIHIKRTISFDQITAQTGIKTSTLQFLNPAYKLDIIPYIQGRNYTIRVPQKKVDVFLKNEKQLYMLADADDAKREKPLPQYFEIDKRIRYRVKKGDYLGKIAYRYGIRVSDIKRWNGLKNNHLTIGQRLSIYPKNIRVPKSTKKQVSQKLPKGTPTIYVVKRGDSLWTIAKKFKKVSVDQIKEWNNIWGTKIIQPGTKLKIYKS